MHNDVYYVFVIMGKNSILKILSVEFITKRKVRPIPKYFNQSITCNS